MSGYSISLIIEIRREEPSLKCRRILDRRKLVNDRIVVAAIFDSMIAQDWGEKKKPSGSLMVSLRVGVRLCGCKNGARV